MLSRKCTLFTLCVVKVNGFFRFGAKRASLASPTDISNEKIVLKGKREEKREGKGKGREGKGIFLGLASGLDSKRRRWVSPIFRGYNARQACRQRETSLP